MFYRHWKRIALALTGFFWASCDSDASITEVREIQPDDNSSDSGKIVSSDSEKKVSSASESTGQSSSSAVVKEDSSSSAIQYVEALYGVLNDVVNCTLNRGDSTVVCEDRTTCKQLTTESWESEYSCVEDICPDYGVVLVSENTYECDGKTYSEAEFRVKHNIVDEYDPSEERVVCYEAGGNAVTCRDGVTYTITTDEKGNKTYTDAEGSILSEEEFEKKYEIQEYAPLYGIFW